MASSKLSALTAITTAGDDDLIYVADTADGGSSYSSKRITRGNLFTGIATESYVATQLANLVDGAPGALDTLNELAAAMADDASFSTTITNLINANETHIDNVATLTGVAKDAVNFGTFTGSTITDNQTLKAILQLLEAAVEARATSTTVTEVDTNVNDLISLSGVAENTTGLGTFTGSTISDDSDIKTALQDLETAAESAAAGSAVADQVKTVTDATDATQYITFVNDDNTSATTEALRTDAGVTFNPSSNLLTVSGTVHAQNLTLDNVNLNATATELNVLDGITATTEELNYVDGVTSAIQTQLDAKQATVTDGDGLAFTGATLAVELDSNVASYTDLTLTASGGGNTVSINKDSSNDLLLNLGASSGASTLTITGGTITVGDTMRVYDDSGVAWQFEVSAIDNTTHNWRTALTASTGTVTRDGTSVTDFATGGTFDGNSFITNGASTLVDIVTLSADAFLEFNSGKLKASVKDEDNMSSDSATHLATQQSIKAYVDGVASNVQTQLDAKTADGDNVNNLVGNTSAETVPVTGGGDDNYLFLVVNKTSGAIVAIDKTFIEAEG